MKKLIALCIVFIGLHANAQLPSEKPIEELLPPSAKKKTSGLKHQSFSFSQAELPSVATFPNQFILNHNKRSSALTQKELQAQLPSNSEMDWPIIPAQKRKKKK